MSKVGEFFRELEEMGLGPVRDEGAEPTNTKEDMPGFEGTWAALDGITIEPSDDALAEIEYMIDNEGFLN